MIVVLGPFLSDLGWAVGGFPGRHGGPAKDSGRRGRLWLSLARGRRRRLFHDFFLCCHGTLNFKGCCLSLLRPSLSSHQECGNVSKRTEYATKILKNFWALI